MTKKTDKISFDFEEKQYPNHTSNGACVIDIEKNLVKVDLSKTADLVNILNLLMREYKKCSITFVP